MPGLEPPHRRENDILQFAAYSVSQNFLAVVFCMVLHGQSFRIWVLLFSVAKTKFLEGCVKQPGPEAIGLIRFARRVKHFRKNAPYTMS